MLFGNRNTVQNTKYSKKLVSGILENLMDSLLLRIALGKDCPFRLVYPTVFIFRVQNS
jgi:hypothetical protein